MMKVTLTRITKDPILAIEEAASNCYNSEPTNDGKIMKHCIKSGHTSVTEFCDFTFHIEGVSRALSHQLVRHRIASYSQKSQRYVKEGQFEYIVPPILAENKIDKSIYEDYLKHSQETYDYLISRGVPAEDARFVLPNACETKIVCTMNARTLMNFFHHRCCERAQWEIRELANQMLSLVREVAPILFKYAGAPCEHGSCPEGSMSCGKPILRESEENK